MDDPQDAQRSYESPIPGSGQSRVGRCLEHSGLVEGVPGQCTANGLDDIKAPSNPNSSMIL